MNDDRDDITRLVCALAEHASRELSTPELDARVQATRGLKDPLARAAAVLGALGWGAEPLAPGLALEGTDRDHPVLLHAPGVGFLLLFGREGASWRTWSEAVGTSGRSEDELAAWLGEGGRALRLVPMGPAGALLGASGRPPLARLGSLIRARGDEIGVILLYGLAAGVLTLATPLAAQVLINTVAFGALRQPLVLLALVLLCALALAALLRALQRVAVEILQRRVFVKMVLDLGWRLPRVRHEAWDQHHGPELINRFFDVLTVQKAAGTLLLDGAGALMQAVVGLMLLAVYHPILLVYDLALMGAVAVVIFWPLRDATASAVKESKAKYAVAGWLEDLASLPQLAKVPGAETLALRRADALARDYVSARQKHFRYALRQLVAALAVQAIAATLLLGVGGWLVIAGQLTLGQLVAAEIVVSAALAGFTKLVEKLDSFYDLLAAVDKLGQLVDLPLERQEGAGLAPSAHPASLSLRGAVLRYSAERPVLTRGGLEVEAGERLAILGGEGQGKGVLAELLAGLREPDQGELLIDGVRAGLLHPAALREVVALASAPELFDGTLRENLAAGREEIDDERLQWALRLVGLDELVSALPQGLETPLGPRGGVLSSLRRVRLVLARAIAGRPRVLVVDGLLDAFTPNDQLWLLDALSDPRNPWTLLVLTRDVRVAALCERTVVLHEGGLWPAVPGEIQRARPTPGEA